MARTRKSEATASAIAPATEETTKMEYVGTHISSNYADKLKAFAAREKRKRAAMHRILLEEAINARTQTLSI